jgi:hypothetical protein
MTSSLMDAGGSVAALDPDSAFGMEENPDPGSKSGIRNIFDP